MSEYHVCAECTDFLGCGDWGLCCKSAPYNFLCSDSTEACERFKPGRPIVPVVVFVGEDGGHHGLHSDDATLADCIEKAKELAGEGCTEVVVRDRDPNRLYPLLWMEGF